MLYAVSGYIASRYNGTRKYIVLSGVWSLSHRSSLSYHSKIWYLNEIWWLSTIVLKDVAPVYFIFDPLYFKLLYEYHNY